MLPILADHCDSRLKFFLVSAPTPPTLGYVSMGCGKCITELFQCETVLGEWRSLGCHGYLGGDAALLRNSRMDIP